MDYSTGHKQAVLRKLLPENSAEPEDWPAQGKFYAVLEPAALAEARLAEYLLPPRPVSRKDPARAGSLRAGQ